MGRDCFFQHFQASDIIGGTAVVGLYVGNGIVGNLCERDGPAAEFLPVVSSLRVPAACACDTAALLEPAFSRWYTPTASEYRIHQSRKTMVAITADLKTKGLVLGIDHCCTRLSCSFAGRRPS